MMNPSQIELENRLKNLEATCASLATKVNEERQGYMKLAEDMQSTKNEMESLWGDVAKLAEKSFEVIPKPCSFYR